MPGMMIFSLLVIVAISWSGGVVAGFFTREIIRTVRSWYQRPPSNQDPDTRGD